jgi:molybdate-binding protein
MTPRALTHDDVSRAIMDDDADADFRPLEVCHCYSLIFLQLKQNPALNCVSSVRDVGCHGTCTQYD